jgi:hypothetical protein
MGQDIGKTRLFPLSLF